MYIRYSTCIQCIHIGDVKYSVQYYNPCTSLCLCGPRTPTNNLTSIVPKDQISDLTEIHSGRTSLQDMGKDVCGEGGSQVKDACYNYC